jgi:predicted transcriptional regulator
MEEAVIRALYKQFMFFSDNGSELIENPAIAINEASKCCGKPRTDVREALLALEEHGIVRRMDTERFAYSMMAKGIDTSRVEEVIKQLTKS